jgi:hypothetical protein
MSDITTPQTLIFQMCGIYKDRQENFKQFNKKSIKNSKLDSLLMLLGGNEVIRAAPCRSAIQLN